jgi:hypothetical protein
VQYSRLLPHAITPRLQACEQQTGCLGRCLLALGSRPQCGALVCRESLALGFTESGMRLVRLRPCAQSSRTVEHDTTCP